MTTYFNDTCNVLSNVKVQEFPFPLGLTEYCLPQKIYDELVASRPSWQAILCGRDPGNNRRMDMPAAYLKDSKNMPKIWHDFLNYHTSRDFYIQILDKFEDYFKEFYPQLRNLRDMMPGIRYADTNSPIYLDCQLSINTPVLKKSTVNHPHIDNPLELWASLLYMKDPDDNAGGDLVIHKCVKPPKFHGKREADLDCIRDYKTIPYAPNTYACFINSPVSIHSVTEREITEKPRLMVNLSLEFDKDKLFNV